MWILLAVAAAALIVVGVLAWRLIGVVGETRKLMESLSALRENALPETRGLLDQGLALGAKAETLLSRRNGGSDGEQGPDR